MDGNHRLKAAERLGLQRVPVIPLSYLGRRVVVRDRSDGGLFDLSRFRRVVDTGTLLPYKTTAHEFEPALPVVSMALKEGWFPQHLLFHRALADDVMLEPLKHAAYELIYVRR